MIAHANCAQCQKLKPPFIALGSSFARHAAATRVPQEPQSHASLIILVWFYRFYHSSSRSGVDLRCDIAIADHSDSRPHSLHVADVLGSADKKRRHVDEV